MASGHTNRILCAADPSGSPDAIETLLAAGDEHAVDAIALVGDIAQPDAGARHVFRKLARATCPVFWVPGPDDVPIGRYLREASSIETAFTGLRGVHGTAAAAPGGLLFAGFGGHVNDDLGQPRDERDSLSYPRWEAEYRLKVLREFDFGELVLLFWTPPAHKGLDRPGSEAVTELIGTYRPRVVVCTGERGVEELGRSLVVAPGCIRDGHYAVVDLHERAAMLHEPAASPAGRPA
jgi:hypothetical protein